MSVESLGMARMRNANDETRRNDEIRMKDFPHKFYTIHWFYLLLQIFGKIRFNSSSDFVFSFVRHSIKLRQSSSSYPAKKKTPVSTAFMTNIASKACTTDVVVA